MTETNKKIFDSEILNTTPFWRAIKQTNDKWSICKWCDYLDWKRKKEIKYPEVLHFCELYILLSLFLSLNVYFTVEIICCDIHGVSLVDRLWHKTLLRCRREHTGINRPRDQTRALPRNNNKCYFVQWVKSPKILAEDEARHPTVTFSVPSLLQKAQY